MTDSTAATARAAARRGVDRASVALLSLAAFLVILAVLGAQLRHSAPAPARARHVIVRREYLTTVVTRIVPAGAEAPAAPTVRQTVSKPPVAAVTAPAPAAPAAVTTRTSPTK